jgi:hypothetical protein
MGSVRIPLEVLKIEHPCPADWNEMQGDERTRFCQGCKKHVHNLSAMQRDEAQRLVCEAAGNLCVRMTIDSAGTIVTVDYAGGEHRDRRRGWRFWTGIGLLGALITGGLRAYTTSSRTLRGTSLGVMVCTRPTTFPTAGPITQPAGNFSTTDASNPSAASAAKDDAP